MNWEYLQIQIKNKNLKFFSFCTQSTVAQSDKRLSFIKDQLRLQAKTGFETRTGQFGMIVITVTVPLVLPKGEK
jgi:hypothetical protein